MYQAYIFNINHRKRPNNGNRDILSDIEIKLEIPRVYLVLVYTPYKIQYVLKKNQNAPGHSEHPPVRGENVKTFRYCYIDERKSTSHRCKDIYLWKQG